MPRVISKRDLRPLDLEVVRDVVRFGVLATDQVERRYGDAALAAVRLPILLSGQFISLWPNVIQGTSVYSATAYGARPGCTPRCPVPPSGRGPARWRPDCGSVPGGPALA